MVDAMISVLFVDDEPELLRLTQIFLERTGAFRVSTSTSAQKTLDSGAIPSYDAIVSDYQMPGMDGIAFLKEVRERFGEIPFILFTGRGREEIVIEAINNGVDFYLQKGGDARAQFAELSTKIQYAVSRRRTEAELQKKNEELNVSYEKIAAAEEELRQQLDELTIKQETLKNSEEKFRAFTENIPDLTTIVDMTGSYTYISPSIQRITGQSGDELLGKKFAEIDGAFGILPEDKEILLKNGRTAVQKPGENIPVPPFRIRDFKGNILSIEGVNTYLPGVKGIQGILFHGREISDRIQAEAALRESEEKYRTLIEVAKEGVVIVQDWRLVFANRHIANFLGVPVEKLAGTPFIDYIWPDDREIIREYYRKWIAGKEIPDECDFRIIGSGSRPAWVFLSSAEIPWQGRPATLHLLTDITERKFAEDLARESEETFRKVIEGAPDAIYIRAEGKFVYLNPAALRLFGVSSGEQLVGTPFLDRIHTKHHEKIKERICEPDDNPDPAQPLEGIYIR
ncbi:MAG: PAS domain S-box protein, partial [Methanoregula sp.]